MPGHHLSLFSSPADTKALLHAIEKKRKLQFVLPGLFHNPNVESLPTLLNLPDLGIAKNGDPNHEQRYLVADEWLPIKVRKVPQRRGGIRYAIDQQLNPQTIIYLPGGLFEKDCLIGGYTATGSNDPHSLELFKLFSKEIRRQFVSIKGNYVGKEAEKWLDQGVRLTWNKKSPTTHDLNRDNQ